MPDLIVLARLDVANAIAPHFSEFSHPLQLATADALTDLGNDPTKVAGFLVPYVAASYGAPALQVIGFASHTPEREKQLETWQKKLGEICSLVLQTTTFEAAKVLIGSAQIEVWPTMPFGKWGKVTLPRK